MKYITKTLLNSVVTLGIMSSAVHASMSMEKKAAAPLALSIADKQKLVVLIKQNQQTIADLRAWASEGSASQKALVISTPAPNAEQKASILKMANSLSISLKKLRETVKVKGTFGIDALRLKNLENFSKEIENSPSPEITKDKMDLFDQFLKQALAS